ncbi:interferon-inducible GTPase 5-like [Heteronotia binoei]|uniref:interferon-inducible GTPase 5-like n=1 Tax=Heteronotia binoei TaxID=13085 RepID=UPI00292DCF15|nr:interferon-inducible GTPase 5-like [Heteronotia binoei]
MGSLISKPLLRCEMEMIKKALENNRLSEVLEESNTNLNLLKNTTLDIAITGVTGAGKSSLVNALRGMTDYEEDAAETGVEQTTMQPEKYLYPKFPEITLWDLPGIGTPEFKPNEYLKMVNFNTYDFFIIVSSGRFTVNDAMLALEIKKMNKQFYFVRTKVDQDISNEGQKPNFSETQTLKKIRTNCCSNLTKEGIVNPRVFLVSRWDLNKYDFPILHQTLAEDLNDLKRPLLIMAMPAFSSEHLEQKKAVVKALIWKKALKSCGVGAILVPGLSVAYDVHLLVSAMKEICVTFGLDEDSLRNLAERIRKPVGVLKSAVRKTPMASQINSEFVKSLATKVLLVTSAMVAEELLRFIPVLGSLVGGATSFATTYYVLKSFLEDAVEDAKNVLVEALEPVMDATRKQFIEKDFIKLRSNLENKSLRSALAETDKKLKLLENTTLHIAVTGNSGAGKSSLLNAFRNMTDGEEGSAKTGVEQTTMEPEKYPHPVFPEITLWDLPGIGTREFKAKEYLKKVNFSRYDFFIIVASERFTMNDAMLASEIQKMKKRFYFVRTKVDQAMDNERRKPNFSETQTLERIRTYCLSNLIKEGIVSPTVFLISRWHLNMYDFPTLHKTLADDLNDLKRSLLIKAMPAFSREHLEQKKEAMEDLIWKKALKSCGVGAIFLPGLSVAFDTALLVSAMKEICKTFGLDDDSLHNLGERVGMPVDVLKSAVQKTPMGNQINSDFVWSLAAKFLLCGCAIAMEELSHFIPILGSLLGGAVSFAATYYMLKDFLEDAEKDAESVLATVAN